MVHDRLEAEVFSGRDALSSSSSIVSVVVATFRRPKDLQRCLIAIRPQIRGHDEIIVVRRDDDLETADLVDELRCDQLQEVVVAGKGKTAAMLAGVEHAHGNIIAFTDDDAIPRPDWIKRLVSRFSDAAVGGVGGRDILHTSARGKSLTEDVGRITPWGKLIGNHHLGTGPPREVMILKGVNMAFRRQALALPQGLRGEGAHIHQEVATSLWCRKRGWRLIYDPAIVVDHYPGERFDADRRHRPEPVAIRDVSYNLVAALLTMEPDLFWRRALYGLLVGDGENPGLVRAAFSVVRREPAVLRRFIPSLAGQVEALVDIARKRPLSMITFDEHVSRA